MFTLKAPWYHIENSSAEGLCGSIYLNASNFRIIGMHVAGSASGKGIC
jgi:hypothetical protein